MSKSVGVTVTSPKGTAVTGVPFLYFDLFQRWETASATASLSGDHYTASTTTPSTGNDPPPSSGARGLIGGARSFGKYYYEVKWTSTHFNDIDGQFEIVSYGGPAFGPFNAAYADLISAPTGQPFPNDNTYCPAGVMVANQGSIWAYGVRTELGVVSPSGMFAGNTFGFAVDLDNGLIWIKLVRGPDLGKASGWNGGGGDPASGFGGIVLLGHGPFLPFGTFSNEVAAGDTSITLNAGQPGQPPLSLNRPPGFSLWPAESL